MRGLRHGGAARRPERRPRRRRPTARTKRRPIRHVDLRGGEVEIKNGVQISARSAPHEADSYGHEPTKKTRAAARSKGNSHSRLGGLQGSGSDGALLARLGGQGFRSARQPPRRASRRADPNCGGRSEEADVQHSLLRCHESAEARFLVRDSLSTKRLQCKKVRKTIGENSESYACANAAQ